MMHPAQKFSWRLVQRYWRSPFWVIPLLILLIALGAEYLPLHAQAQEIPAAVSRCIPQQTRQPIVRSELIGSTQLQGKAYYLLSAYIDNAEPPIDLIIAVINGRCEEVFFNPMGDRIAFASVVPQAVAQQLTLARYRREMGRIGKDRFQQQINEAARSAQNPIWFAEEVWALRQLGIAIPATVRVEP
jgi:hypothetical protein